MSTAPQISDVPALLGGNPLRPQGPPAWPIADPDIDDVLQRAAREGWWGRYQGGQTERLEAALREYLHVEHVLLCGSGNYAVELALRALKIGPGDEVILSAYDYPGNFLSIHAVGAMPVLVDVDSRNWNISLDAIRQALGIGRNTRAILVSHLHGGRAPMPEIMELALDQGFAVIEDAAQATGALIDGRRAGTWGHVGVFSFGGSKKLTSGRGGALFSNLPWVAQQARNHLVRAGNVVCPLSDLQAALLLPQLARLDERNALCWKNVQTLCTALVGIPGVRLFVDADEPALPAFYKLGIQFDAAAFGLPRDVVVKALQAEGFAVDEGFAAAHHARSPKRYRQGSKMLIEVERVHRGCVMLHHPMLLESADAMHDFARAWRRIHAHAAKFA